MDEVIPPQLPASPGPSSPGDLRILIVDDSATQLELLRFLLENAGYLVSVATNGAEALISLQQARFALVISDIVMPVMNGYELCSKIKRDPHFGDVPVMLLTRLADVEDIIVGLEAEADYYVTKPYSEQFLLSRVQALLSRREISPDDESARGAGDNELQVTLAGRSFTVSAERRQILNFLVSTYENAIQRNRELFEAQRDLKISNQLLTEQTLKARAAENNYFAVLHNNPDAMIVLDEQRHICFMNAAATNLLGEDRPAIDRIVQTLPLVADTHVEIDLQPHDGLPILAELRVVETTWEGRSASLASLRDVTVRRLTERRVQEQQQQLHEANRRLQQMALLDVMTGLHNFRAFKERCREEVARAYRYGTPLSLLLLDIDRFKSYNDEFGHPAGDELLGAIGDILREHVRASDFPARYGGEEFVVLLSNTDAVGAVDLAERLRVALEKVDWKLRDVTASFGVATLSDTIAECSALLAAADRAMYQSKFGGRNRVTHFQDIDREQVHGMDNRNLHLNDHNQITHSQDLDIKNLTDPS